MGLMSRRNNRCFNLLFSHLILLFPMLYFSIALTRFNLTFVSFPFDNRISDVEKKIHHNKKKRQQTRRNIVITHSKQKYIHDINGDLIQFKLQSDIK